MYVAYYRKLDMSSPLESSDIYPTAERGFPWMSTTVKMVIDSVFVYFFSDQVQRTRDVQFSLGIVVIQ